MKIITLIIFKIFKRLLSGKIAGVCILEEII